MSEAVREARAEGILKEEAQKDTPPRTDGLSDEEFSSFMDSINTMAPLLKGLGGIFGGKRSEACAVR